MRALTYRRSTTSVLAAALVCTVLWTVPASAVQGSDGSTTASCDPTWTQVSAPQAAGALANSDGGSLGPGQISKLLGVQALAKNDVWSVGTYMDNGEEDPARDTNVTDAEHKTVSGWQQAPTPGMPPFGETDFSSVSFDRSNDGWAAGSWYSLDVGPLVEHWDGTRWAVSATLAPPTPAGSTVSAIKAFSPNNVWITVTPLKALGGSPGHNWIEHWDGTTWNYVSYPGETDPAADPQLWSMSGTSPDDLWIFGGRHDMDGPVAYHWTGNGFTATEMPTPDATIGYRFTSAGAAAANDVWVAGFYGDSNTKTYIPLTEQWDGHAWHAIPGQAPSSGDGYTVFNGITVISPKDAWAVGDYTTGPYSKAQPLVEHWNGTTWTMSGLPGFNPDDITQVASVSASSATDIWAVGFSEQPIPDAGTSDSVPVAYHYGCGAS